MASGRWCGAILVGERDVEKKKDRKKKVTIGDG